jgi:predicted XRE-type DNA-binding protein
MVIMKKQLKLFLAVFTLAIFTAVAAGCGSSQTGTSAQDHNSANNSPTQTTSTMPNEDPNVFIKDMNQTVAMITEQTKLNKLEDAKKSAAELVAINEKLSVHITASKLQEDLRQAVIAVRDEVQKPSPSQSAIEKSLQGVKNLLNQISNQMKSHKHQ